VKRESFVFLDEKGYAVKYREISARFLEIQGGRTRLTPVKMSGKGCT